MRVSLFLSLILSLLFACWAVAADKIVLVAGAVPLSAEDTVIKERVESLGFEVELHSQDEAQPVDTTGAAGVFVLETVGSGSITNAYSGLPIPFITAETFFLDEMGFAPDNHTYDDPNQTSVVIVDPDHPIAGGLEGEVTIAPAPVWIMATCDPQGDVQIVARATVNNCACVAVYEEGAKKMDGSKVPARRVITFISRENAPIMTDDGWKLFDNSFLWGMGQLEASVSPKGSVAATWGALKVHYH